MTWELDRYFLIATLPNNQNTFDIYVPEHQDGFQLLGVIVDLIDNLVEEWYSGLMETSYVNMTGSIQRLAPCVTCRADMYDDCHFFTVSACTQASFHSDTVECPTCGPRLIRKVTPEVVFADIDSSLVVETLNIDEMSIRTEDKRLGRGAFSNVYKINVEGENLAAKVYIFIFFNSRISVIKEFPF